MFFHEQRRSLNDCFSAPFLFSGGIKMEHFHEECGVFGIFSKHRKDVASLSYYALYSLQHRGQESAGIVVNDDGLLTCYKDKGLVSEVFTNEHLHAMPQGHIAIGHVRYGTTGLDAKKNAQPICINHMNGNLALAHNGNLVNSYELRKELESTGSIFYTTSDTESIVYTIVHERLTSKSIEEAVYKAVQKLEGAFSLVISSPSKLIAVRDPHGFRPLCMGQRDDGDIVFASETCALDAVGAKFIRDILPGEIVTVSNSGIHSNKSLCETCPKSLCAFEYIYFARSDSNIDGYNVHMARLKCGEFLAQNDNVEADLVIGVPDSGLDAALGYANASKIPYTHGFVKNKYIGRTFISPTTSQRDTALNIKLNPIRDVINGKRIILVDDSIVRGSTCRKIIRALRQAGAKEIHMRISSPPFIGACYYGTDIDSPDNLIANQHTIEEIAKIIEVDSLAYLTVDQLKQIVPHGHELCTACFDLKYPTKVHTHSSKSKFETKIKQ